jgi:hypothetical protein
MAIEINQVKLTLLGCDILATITTRMMVASGQISTKLLEVNKFN